MYGGICVKWPEVTHSSVDRRAVPSQVAGNWKQFGSTALTSSSYVCKIFFYIHFSLTYASLPIPLHVRQRKTQQHQHTHIKVIYLLCTIHHLFSSLSLSLFLSQFTYLSRESQCLVNINDEWGIRCDDTITELEISLR